jgi:hypothetical protein
MDGSLLHLSTQELRVVFMKESKRFLKALNHNSPGENRESREDTLNEITENLKEITHLLGLREAQVELPQN